MTRSLAVVSKSLGVGLLLLLGMSCSSDDDSLSRWLCYENGTCSCRIPKLGSDGDWGDYEVPYCELGSSCCLLTEQETETSIAQCECFDTDSSCEAEAASRRNTTAVSECPPPGTVERKPLVCAEIGENCRQSYLLDNDLTGCCEGSVCLENSDQVPVCTAASNEDIALGAECTKAAREGDSLELVTPTIRTDRGELTLEAVDIRSQTTGAGGCLTAFTLALGGFSSGCGLDLAVQVIGGKLVTTAVMGDIQRCPGYEEIPRSSSAASLPATLRSRSRSGG